MGKITALFLLWLIPVSLNGQSILAGKIVDKEGKAIQGASISIKDTYDGATSSAEGLFKFQTAEQGPQQIVVQYLGFKTVTQNIDLTKDNTNLKFILLEDGNVLEAVTITAGAFDASDEKKAVMLKPMDIVTTASAGGDIYGALSTLPGTQTVGEEGKLFVRGGDAYEARTHIDGLQVESPYQSRMQGIPTKGRFSPLLFSGTMFSTGGYSAEYGQALSSVLLLKTDGMPAENKFNVNLYTLGFGVSGTKKLDNTAYIAALDYTNLGPYYNVVSQNADWIKSPQTISGTLNVIHKTRSGGLSKTLFSYNDDRSELNYPYYGYDQPSVAVSLINNNLFIKHTYVNSISEHTKMDVGLAFSFDRNYLSLDTIAIDDGLFSGQVKLKFVTWLSGKVNLSYGGDLIYKNFKEDIQLRQTAAALKYNDFQNTLFSELDYALSSKLALRIGFRGEHSSGIESYRMMPRASFAYSVGKHSQVSAAFGTFYQNPLYEYLKFSTGLKPEQATHFILDYQFKLKDRVFRVEGFYKDYKDLVTFKITDDPNPGNYASDGYGYAKGIDVFYRDSESIKNGDFWVSYAYLDTKRRYQDYPVYATPKYFSKHNFSFVYKQWIASVKSYLGGSFTYASGRPYYDPNKSTAFFLTDKTKAYQNLSVNYSYDLSAITKIPVTFYTSVSNVFGSANIYGYNYAMNSSTNKYDLIPVVPQASRFYLIALFMSL